MTTKYLGDEFKIYTGDGTSPETFTVLAGQTGLTYNAPTNFIDTSSKATGRVGTQRPGRRAITVSVDGKMELPDTAGVEYVHGLSIADPSVPGNFQIRKTPFGTSDVVFECSMYVGGFNNSYPDQDNATYSFDLTAAEAPTTEALD